MPSINNIVRNAEVQLDALQSNRWWSKQSGSLHVCGLLDDGNRQLGWFTNTPDGRHAEDNAIRRLNQIKGTR
jgi:hypothetical protein